MAARFISEFQMVSRFIAARTRGFAAASLLGAVFMASPASALSYRLADAELPGCKGPCPKVVVATGTIGQNEHAELVSFLDEAMKSDRVAEVILIDSPGGFTVGAMTMAYVLRKLKMTVIVGRWTGDTITPTGGLTSGTCASACVFTLSGGTSRYFVAGSRVGVHRQHTGRQVLDPTTRKPVNATVDYESGFDLYRKFFASLGVDGPGVVAKLSKTPSEDMYWFSPEEMAKHRIARDVSTRGQGGRKRN